MIEKIKMLYAKDSKETANNFKELLATSETQNILYPYFNTFLKMINDEKYLVRLKGFRLLCKQAKWDNENEIDSNIEKILSAIADEKPTAVRQKISSLEDIVLYKNNLKSQIKDYLILLDYSNFNDSMKEIIAKDIRYILELIG